MPEIVASTAPPDTAAPAASADAGTQADAAAPTASQRELASAVPASPAGPADQESPTAPPPGLDLPPIAQALRFVARPMALHINAQRTFGDVWTLRLPSQRSGWIVTSHPDHLRSLMTANPADAPSLTAESPLRPILGESSVLTTVGERHMRQRKLLLPAFHGDAVDSYVAAISRLTERELDGWSTGEPFALAPRMQAITLDVIMRGVFGLEPDDRDDGPELALRHALSRVLRVTAHPLYALLELRHAGAKEASGLLARLLASLDRRLYDVISQRRRTPPQGRDDVLAVLLGARDESGEPLTDGELRDQLLTLVLAGHETTANSLAWIFERLLRTPDAYARLRESVRSDDGDAYVEATIHEGMRARPVIPMIVRRVMRPWRLGEHTLASGTPVAVSIIGLHHRPDLYSQPHAFRPERFLSAQGAFERPGTYNWIPFGGGIRRCLGATMAMAEQRVVVKAIARRFDLVAPEPAWEAPRMRNVTMIPRGGCRVAVAHRYGT
ncbi:MAG: cytochrome P450 [Solirubrobacteraceae bacterium]